jgi:transcriptional regulator with XRE-family HTH domain
MPETLSEQKRRARAQARAAALGNAIRRLRREHQLTIQTLAFDAGMHTTYLSGIERGRRNPTWEKLNDLADALELPLKRVVEVAEQERAIALARARIEAGDNAIR